jgi:hypothetical protein
VLRNNQPCETLFTGDEYSDQCCVVMSEICKPFSMLFALQVTITR